MMISVVQIIVVMRNVAKLIVLLGIHGIQIIAIIKKDLSTMVIHLVVCDATQPPRQEVKKSTYTNCKSVIIESI